MNRKQRRAAKRQPINLPKSQEILLQRITKNGITPKDLEKEWMRGVDAGRTMAIKTCYAAVCLAAKEVCGFGKQRILKLLYAMDEHVCDTLTSADIIERVYAEMGITIDFAQPFDRITERDE